MQIGRFKSGNTKPVNLEKTLNTIMFVVSLVVLVGFSVNFDLPESSLAVQTTGHVTALEVIRSENKIKMPCESKTDEEKELLKKEIRDYEASPKFKRKIMECRGDMDMPPRHKVIFTYLKENVLQKGWSILDLGAAAGGMLRMVIEAYSQEESLMGKRGKFQGVELVQGWVDFASEYFSDSVRWGDVRFVQGDITDFELPDKNFTFDFVMLNDVMEHLQTNRYGCFFQKLKSVTHKGSIVYMHTPTPETQIHDSDQYFENVLPHHVLVMGMAQVGFELLSFELDTATSCRRVKLHKGQNLPRQADHALCYFRGFVKYYHATFYRVHDESVFDLN